MSRLRSLVLERCSSLVALPVSVGFLRQLRTISLGHCSALKDIPNLEGMPLTMLVIKHCDRLVAAPEALAQLCRLDALEVAACGSLEEWPEFGFDVHGRDFSFLLDDGPSQLVRRFLHGYTIFPQYYKLYQQPPGRLPGRARAGQGLRVLQISGCPLLKKLPNSLGLAQNMEHLQLQGCSVLEELPQSLGRLHCLTALEVLDCSKLKSLPDSICDLEALRVIRIKNCTSLASLPNLKSRVFNTWELGPGPLPFLKLLVLTECSVTRIPDSYGRLHKLAQLDLSGCSKLEALPPYMQGITGLRTLSVASCSKLRKLPEKLPASLKELDLSYCRELASLGESLVLLADQIGEVRVSLAGWDHLFPDDPYMQEQHKFGLVPVFELNGIKAALRQATVIENCWAMRALCSTCSPSCRGLPRCWLQQPLLLAVHHRAAGSRAACPATAIKPWGRAPAQLPAVPKPGCSTFFLFDLLTFGFASALVMFLVAFAIPRRDVGDRAAVAGGMYLSLCLSVVLLSAALGCGMWALWAGVLSVYPSEFVRRDVWAPFAVSMAVMSAAFIKLTSRPLLLFPGWLALRKAVTCSFTGQWLVHVFQLLRRQQQQPYQGVRIE